jgi:peptidase E
MPCNGASSTTAAALGKPIAMETPRIVAFGGWAEEPLWDYVFRLSPRESPKLLLVPTASVDDPRFVLDTYERLRPRADVSHLTFFPRPADDLRERTLAQDIIAVGGGNTANMLAIWRVHGFDRILREAWESGVVLCGGSAGAICWFEASVTDSFGPELAGMRDGLGFLPGSACPHYDGEELRRPRYTELVRHGFPPGIAIDDFAAARFDGTALTEVLTTRAGARAYRVSPAGEDPLEARLLT